MKLRKQLIFTITFLALIFSYSDGYCKKIFYDKETLSNKEKVQEIIKRNCYRMSQRFNAPLKNEDKNKYKDALNWGRIDCECNVSVAYQIWGPKFMDLLLNKGYSVLEALEKVQLDDLYKKNKSYNLKYEELCQQCRRKYYH